MVPDIPTHVRIRGRRWRVWRESVTLGRGPEGERRARDLRGFHGYSDEARREIVVARHKSPAAERQTFLHELLHACSGSETSMRWEERFIRDVERPLMRALEQLRWR